MQTSELLAKVRKIEIKTRRMVEELTGGAYRSVFKGRGIEFSEVREYTTTDDVRDIDWNVTARMGQPYIKKYAEERELTVILAVDASASGAFGSSSVEKRGQMAETAALLAFSAIRNNDRVGLLIFTDETELYLPPRSGRSNVLRVIRELVAFEPKRKGTNIGNALESLARAIKKKAVVFLFSDFIDGGDYERNLKIVARKHDLIAVRVLDKSELSMPVTGSIVLEDSESGASFAFDCGAPGAAAFAEAADKMHNEVRDLCRRAKVDMIDLRCGDDLAKPLMTFFKTRAQVRR